MKITRIVETTRDSVRTRFHLSHGVYSLGGKPITLLCARRANNTGDGTHIRIGVISALYSMDDEKSFSKLYSEKVKQGMLDDMGPNWYEESMKH